MLMYVGDSLGVCKMGQMSSFRGQRVMFAGWVLEREKGADVKTCCHCGFVGDLSVRVLRFRGSFSPLLIEIVGVVPRQHECS